MRFRGLVVVVLAGLCLSLWACAAITGLSDYELVNDASADDGGAPLPLVDGSSTDGGIEAGGEITAGGLTFTPAAVTFPKVACGVEQTAQISVLSGDEPATVDVSIEASDAFSIAEAVQGSVHLELAPHQKTSFTVKAKPTTPGAASADVILKIAGEAEHHIAVSLVTAGGSLSLGTSTVDFGTVKADTTTKQSVTFRNDGRDDVIVKGFNPPLTNFAIDVPFTVPAGAAVERDVQLKSGTAGSALSETTEPQADGLCGAIPKLVLKGQRSDAPLTASPLTIDFGDVNCGAALPAAKAVTISNYGSGAKGFAASLPASASAFAITGATSGTIASGTDTVPATATVTIGLAAAGSIPSDLTGNLTITLDGGTVFTVALHARVRGALLEASASTLKLPKSTGSAGAGNVTLTNKGNVTACVKYARTSNTYVSEDWTCVGGHVGTNCYVTDDTDQVNANTSTDWSVRYLSGSGSTTITANIVACANGGGTAPLCGTAPKIVVSAN